MQALLDRAGLERSLAPRRDEIVMGKTGFVLEPFRPHADQVGHRMQFLSGVGPQMAPAMAVPFTHAPDPRVARRENEERIDVAAHGFGFFPPVNNSTHNQVATQMNANTKQSAIIGRMIGETNKAEIRAKVFMSFQRSRILFMGAENYRRASQEGFPHARRGHPGRHSGPGYGKVFERESIGKATNAGERIGDSLIRQ